MTQDAQYAIEAWYQGILIDECVYDRGAILTLQLTDSLQKTLTVSNSEMMGIRAWYDAHFPNNRPT